MSKEKEILNQELRFKYGNELDKIQNHISRIRFVAISSVNSLEEQDKEIERLHSIIKEIREYLNFIKEKQKVVGVYTKDIHKHILEILDKVDKEK